jgi:hypothetical protein
MALHLSLLFAGFDNVLLFILSSSLADTSVPDDRLDVLRPRIPLGATTSAESGTETKVARLADPNIKSHSSHFVPKRTPTSTALPFATFLLFGFPLSNTALLSMLFSTSRINRLAQHLLVSEG